MEKSSEIQNRIYRVRGQHVMLDVDLAELYHVETRVLNQAVKRNMARFPLDFMFELSRAEIMRISQTVISSGRPGSLKFAKKVHAFTEHGICMLSGVLNSPHAIQINLFIVRAFVRLRHAVLASRDIARRVEKLEGDVHILKTDVRFMHEDLQKKTFPPEITGPRVQGFEKE